MRQVVRLKGCLAALVLSMGLLAAQQVSAQDAKPFTNQQLDQMTAPIALYPDSLLSQLLMATTYPDDFAAAYAWAKAHPDAKGDDAVKMVEDEKWDPSVQSLVGFPEVLITFGAKPDWVKDMGDAFLAQPDDVMDSVQRLRAQAQAAGNLKSNEQINVSTEATPPPDASDPVPSQPPPPQTIIIQPAQPTVVYVPAYNPAVVYGPWMYPAYPPYYYPPPPGYWFSRTIATGIAWGVGIGVSNALWGGFNWGHGSVNINVNRYNNININRQINVNSNRTNWHHNPNNRATPYRGGTQTRQQLDKQYQAGNRQQYRGKDSSPSRDASRERAAQAMQTRGFEGNGNGGSGNQPGGDRAGGRGDQQNGGRPGAGNAGQNGGRPGAGNAAQNADRAAARDRQQNMERDASRQRAQSAGRDNALSGVNSGQARQQFDRGQASQRSAQQRPSGGNARPQGGRPSGGAHAGGGARPGGGGGGGRPGGGGGGGRKR